MKRGRFELFVVYPDGVPGAICKFATEEGALAVRSALQHGAGYMEFFGVYDLDDPERGVLA